MNDNNVSQNDPLNNVNTTELLNNYFNNLQPPIFDMSSNESLIPMSRLRPKYIIPQYVPLQPTDDNSITIINIFDVIVVSPQTNLFEVFRFVTIPVPPQFINNLEMQQQLNDSSVTNDLRTTNDLETQFRQ